MLDAHGPHGSLVGATLGSYRVTGKIGAGGMGVVYRAQDLRLDRTVAVKALPESAGSDPVARRKLMDEARRGSRVVSPYAATVFDVVEQDDRAYIVMEHIDGRRLDRVLREDHPDLNTVTGFAIEIAEALTAIHGAGLVHRDLKPANVMITPAGHVKVMDFGLARDDAATLLKRAESDSTLSTQTHPGAIAGTILYMSPEQVRGEPLDARSDLFSFGTLLYEAVTGTHPFERDSILASASAILHEPPSGTSEPPQLVSSPVAPIVHRLLEKDRDRRYTTAEIVLEDLRAARSGAAISVTPQPKPVGRRVALFAAVVLAVATIVVGAIKFWPSQPKEGRPGSRPVLAVLPFEDKTGEPRGDLRAQLLADLLATDLAESSLVRALPSDRVREILIGVDTRSSQKPALAAIAKAVDVRWIVAGALYQENHALYASVGIYRPGESEPSSSFRADAGTTAAIAEIASVKLRDRLFPDRKDDRSEGGPGVAGGSTSEEAMLLEQEAKKALRELRYGDAIERLDKAVHLDPGFLRAQIQLAGALDRSGYGTRAAETADRALRTVEQLGDAGRNTSLSLEARAVHARINNDANGEIEARRSLVARHGDDPTAHLNLARALDLRGRSADAFPEIELAIALDETDPVAHLSRAKLLNSAHRFDEAAKEFDRAEALFAEVGSAAGQASVARARGDSEYVRARYASAERFFERAAAQQSAAGLTVLAAHSRKGSGDCELQLGRLDAAVAIYEPVLAVARSAGAHRTIVNVLSSLGAQHLVRGHFDRAEQVLRDARNEAVGLGNPRLLASPTLNLASALASLGRYGESRALAEEALKLARDAGDDQVQSKSMLVLANVRYHEGDLDDAIRGYREVRDSAPLANAPGNPLGNVHLGLAHILRESGRLKEAVESADQAVAVNRAANQRVMLCDSLVARARVRADLALDAGAEADLAEASKVASEPAPPLDSLLRTVALGRAALAMTRARWDAAERELSSLRADIGSDPAASLDVTVLGLSAQVARARGHARDAMRYARSRVANTTGSPVERTNARVELAHADLSLANRAEAASEARRALDEAERMNVPLVASLACAALLTIGEGVDAEAIRARGQAAMERYLDAAPEDRRDSLRARSDVHAALRVLDNTAASQQSR